MNRRLFEHDLSEDQLQTKLHLSRGLSREYLPRRRLTDVYIWRIQIGHVGNVEDLPPELEVGRLRDVEVLQQRHVQAAERRCVQNSHTGIAIGIGRGRRERGCVEPSRSSLVWRGQRADKVWSRVISVP